MADARKPLFSWLADWRRDQLSGTLCDIFLADGAGVPMRRVTEVKVLAGLGLSGDRYVQDAGHWKGCDAVQVTLVRAEDIERAEQRSGVALCRGEHRRNLVVRGIPIDAYRGRRLRIGDVHFEFHRLRPPCGYLDRLGQRGSAKALGKAAGIGVRALADGTIRVGDAVRILAH